MVLIWRCYLNQNESNKAVNAFLTEDLTVGIGVPLGVHREVPKYADIAT